MSVPDEASARASARASDLVARFTLESGHERVRRVFGGARVVRYADALAVTEVEPLMACVGSIPLGLDAAQLRGVREVVEAHIERYGASYLNKDAGLVVPAPPDGRAA